MRVATWSGAYGDAMQAAVFKPFTKATGITVRIDQANGDLTMMDDGAKPAPWDVIDLAEASLTVGCAEGRFRRLDHASLLGDTAKDDFIQGLLHPCGVGALVWSQAVAYDATALAKRPPQTLADFFDLENYPGKRGLYDGAEGNLEIALMADGIPPEDVYDVLRKPDGADHAFAKLASLRGSIEFWRFGGGPERLLNESRVLMTTAYAGRFLRPRSGARRPAGVMWTNQLWRATFLAIPAHPRNLANGQRFISFATDAERLGRLAARLRFGPGRRSAMDVVPENVRDTLPTVRRNFHDALRVETGFWAEFGPELEARFDAWRNTQ